MLGETFTLPCASGDVVCAKINFDAFTSTYRYASSTRRILVTVRHSTTRSGKDRHNVEIVETVFATAEASEIVRKTYLVIENDPSDTDAENVDALADWLIASAGANLTKLFNWES